MSEVYDEAARRRRVYVRPELVLLEYEEEDFFGDSSEFEDPDAGTWI